MSALYKKHLEALANLKLSSQVRLEKATPQALVLSGGETRFKIRAQSGSNQLELGLELLRLAQG